MTRLPARWRLSNGLTVIYQRDPGFTLACATLLLRTGSRHESESQAGLCSMTVDLLMQGTRHRTARQLASVMESVGASMGTQVHEDYAEMGFVVPSTEMDRALGVMSEVLAEPSFPREEIVKEKAHVLAGLKSRKDAIFNVAYDELAARFYGRHPYGRPLEGLPKTVASFRRSEFQHWHKQSIHPESAILSWTGPMAVSEAQRLVEKHLGGWGSTAASMNSALVPIGLIPKSGATDVTLKSSFEQAYLMVGFPAPCATDPDQIPLKVLNTALGGGMSSRLFTVLREESGLAYEVSSFYPTRLETSQWVIYLGLPKEKLEIAARQLKGLLRLTADKGLSDEEVRQAKAMIRGAFLMDRQTHRRKGWYAAWWEFLGRDLNYGNEFLKAVDAVTPKQLQALMQKMIDQPRVTVRVVPK